MNYETLTYAVADNVARIGLNRPDRLNALTPKLLEELSIALDQVVADGARALILTGEGRAFCSGADLIASGERGMPDDLGALLDSHYHPAIERIVNLPVPVVTAINGPAVGAGLSFALAGDIILAARSSYLLLSFASIGLVPDAGATWFVSRAVGRAKAMEMALLADRISAERAEAMGLITRAVDDDALEAETAAIAARLASGATQALGRIRRQVNAALEFSLTDTLAIERANQRDVGHTGDFREAIIAFAQKRPPVFKGQ